MVLGGESEAERGRRVHDVIRGCIRRRVAGETLLDEQIASDHPDLMPELGQELKALALIEQAEQRASDTLNHANDGSGDVSLPADSFAGYEITGEIHRGGQGVVYEALQKSTQRKVAIKAMKEGPFGRPGDRTRFEREVQILGQLKHPHIVTIHDSGSAPSGFYFVMDYIAGAALDEFMAGKEQSVRETLELFARICDAVNAAHLHGIIHRDLKPSNIRVDAEAEPHILDFGLAKIATGEDEPSGMTLTGQFVGSVPWASPEQAGGMPHKIDMRTDVYSLGMILYHMLTGRFPYEVTGNIRDVIDNILKAEPIRPSTIRRQIDDEVETIVLKCLSKEPQRRYQTAGELVRDIGRYLAGEPIEAKRDSVGYVFRKNLRRYRIPLAIAGAFAVVVTIGFVASLMFWRDAVHERDAAEQARQVARTAQTEAERQAAIAEAVNDFLNKDLLAAASPFKTRNPEITVREALKTAAEAIEDRFDDEPLVEAAIQATLGDTYEALGNYEAAEPHAKRALELRSNWLGEEHAVTLESMCALARLYVEQGHYGDAEPLYARTLELQRRVLGQDHPKTLTTMHGVAMLYTQQGRYDEAETAYLQVLELRRRVLREDHGCTWRSITGLASLYKDLDRYEEAESLLLPLLERQRRTLTDEHPDTLATGIALAEVYRRQERRDEAEALLVRVLEGLRRVLGEEHSVTLECINNLAHLYRDQGRYDEAEPLFSEVIETGRRVLGSDHLLTLTAMTNLAVVYRKQGRYEEAEPLYLETLETKRRALGEEHPQTISCLASLGVLYYYMDRLDEAEPLLLEAIEKYRRVLGENHTHTLAPMASLASVYEKQERFEEAERVYRALVQQYRKIHGPEHRATLWSMQGVTRSLTATGRFTEAEPLARELQTLCESNAARIPPTMMAKSLYLLADILLHNGRPDEAEPLLRKCLEIRRTSAADDRLIANTESLLGGCLTALGRYEEAKPLLLESYSRIKVTGEEADDLTRAACQRIIDLYDAWGDPEKANEWRVELPGTTEMPEAPGTGN